MIGRILVILFLATVLLAGYTGYQAIHVKHGLETVASELDPAVQDLQAGDPGALRHRLAVVQDGAAEAADNSNGPGWWIASRLPRYGDDVQAIRTVSSVSDVLASRVLPDVVRAGETVKNINPYDGQAAVAQLQHAGKSLARAKNEFEQQKARVAAIDTAELDPRLAGPVHQLQTALAGADDYIQGLAGDAQQALAPFS